MWITSVGAPSFRLARYLKNGVHAQLRFRPRLLFVSQKITKFPTLVASKSKNQSLRHMVSGYIEKSAGYWSRVRWVDGLNSVSINSMSFAEL
ncbi:hypothetical protein TNCV_4111771 [Trichonephila clavipes]|nr:hypothetical protein TNCV_4111771 [Trichonephila clavipes]